jgi:hypothetical protein
MWRTDVCNIAMFLANRALAQTYEDTETDQSKEGYVFWRHPKRVKVCCARSGCRCMRAGRVTLRLLLLFRMSVI